MTQGAIRAEQQEQAEHDDEYDQGYSFLHGWLVVCFKWPINKLSSLLFSACE